MRRTHRGLTTVALLSLVGGSAFAQQAHAEGYEEVQQERDQQAEQQRGQQMLQREAEQGQQPADQRQQQAGAQQQDAQQQRQQDAQQQRQQDAQQQRQQAAQQQAQQNQLLQQAQADSVQLSALDADQVSALQQTLQQRGYYQGEIDGLVGPKTRTALRRFYNDRAQLAARGRILPDSAESLGMDAAQIERVRGQEAAEGTEFEQRSLRGEDPTQQTNQRTQERTNQPTQERTNQPMQEQNDELFNGEPLEEPFE